MRWLFNVLKAMAVCLGLLVGVAFFLPSHGHVERSLDLFVPIQRVWGLIADPQQWSTWSPWSLKDPAMKLRFEGAESRRLLTYTLTLVELGVPAHGAFTLDTTPVGTRVTWSLDADFGMNPVGRWLGLGLEHTVGADLERGLGRLARISKD
ncbi:SRPBCC family protein [Leptothrix ochracea]|uniref:SRPBCC family protein n=1 Tax=Leptothrix ochracea TaxID=735331 RepID=UPI0034E1BA2B